MAYLREQNLLFIHIPKNAGRSIYVSLGFIEIDKIGRQGKRSLLNRVATYSRKLTSNAFVKENLYGTLDYTFAAQHLTLQEIELLGLIPSRKLSETLKFAVVRDPFDRALSTFSHFYKNELLNKHEFERFCLDWYDDDSVNHNVLAHRRKQIEFIRSTDGSIGVDRLLVFDDLKRQLETLSREYGISLHAPFPHVGRKRTSDLRVLYTTRSRSEISRRFAEDLEVYESIRKKERIGGR